MYCAGDASDQSKGEASGISGKKYRNLLLPGEKCEHAPAKVFSRVGHVAFRRDVYLSSDFLREVVISVGFQPATHGQPFRGLIAVPAFLVCQYYFLHVVAEIVEFADKPRER